MYLSPVAIFFYFIFLQVCVVHELPFWDSKLISYLTFPAKNVDLYVTCIHQKCQYQKCFLMLVATH